MDGSYIYENFPKNEYEHKYHPRIAAAIKRLFFQQSSDCAKRAGGYDKDPVQFPDAVRYDQLTFQDVLAGELGVMDATAIALCKDNSIPIVVFDLFGPGNIARAVAGEPIGTRITSAA